MDQETREIDQDEAATLCFELSSLAFQYPTAEFSEAVANGAFLKAVNDVSEALGIDDMGCSEIPTDPEECTHHLRQAYTDLFYTMPTAKVPLYESVWRGHALGKKPMIFADDATISVRAAYRSAGIDIEDTHEPADHIATELGFIAEMIRRGDAAEAENFADQHLFVWLDPFCQAISSLSSDTFYSALAKWVRSSVTSIFLKPSGSVSHG